MAATPETKVKSDIKKWLNANRIYHFSPIGGPFSVHGIPDLILCYHGRFVAVECKAPGKEKNTTRNQDFHIRRINECEGLAFVASSVQDVIDRLASLS